MTKAQLIGMADILTDAPRDSASCVAKNNLMTSGTGEGTLDGFYWIKTGVEPGIDVFSNGVSRGRVKKIV